MKYILGIETSCDDTSIAIVDEKLRVTAIKTVSQTTVHALFGGIMPEIAARNHAAYIFPVLNKVLGEAGLSQEEISAIAVTNFPGLIGSLLIGVSVAKGLAIGWKKPLIAVNHLEGHIYSAFLEKETMPEIPYLALVVSGGHTTLMEFNENGKTILGETFDDAAGEAYDKVAKMAGLGYPGGPVIDKMAAEGNASRYELPYLLKNQKYKNTFEFSFSGLKTAVKKFLEEESDLVMKDLMAGFQAKLVELIERRLILAFSQKHYKALVIAGGVAANSGIRKMAEKLAEKNGVPLFMPPLKYCQDNGAMIAAAGFADLAQGNFSQLNTTVFPTIRGTK